MSACSFALTDSMEKSSHRRATAKCLYNQSNNWLSNNCLHYFLTLWEINRYFQVITNKYVLNIVWSLLRRSVASLLHTVSCMPTFNATPQWLKVMFHTKGEMHSGRWKPQSMFRAKAQIGMMKRMKVVFKWRVEKLRKKTSAWSGRKTAAVDSHHATASNLCHVFISLRLQSVPVTSMLGPKNISATSQLNVLMKS